LRTAFVGGWGSQFNGLGRLTRFITEYLPRFSAASDDMGLGVVFLQRHRVEVGLKLLLERADAQADDYTRSHDLRGLRDLCGPILEEAALRPSWRGLRQAHDDFIELMDEVDPNGATFRYPVDTRSRPVERPQLVDLIELESEGAAFQATVDTLVDSLARREGLQIANPEREKAAEELAAAIRSIQTLEAVLQIVEEATATAGSHLGTLLRDSTARIAEARAARDEQMAVIRHLGDQLERCLDLIAKDLELSVEDFNLAPASVHELPAFEVRFGTGGQREINRLIDWTGKMYAAPFRELGHTLRAVHKRSASWPGLANQQLHMDLGRFLSRFYRVSSPPT
jgi:hypothetical protein